MFRGFISSTTWSEMCAAPPASSCQKKAPLLQLLRVEKMKWFANRHVRLTDDDDHSSGGDSSHSLLPRSAKNSFGAFAAHMGMILSLVSDSEFELCYGCPPCSLMLAQVHRSSVRNLRGTLVGACTVSLVVRPAAPQLHACRVTHVCSLGGFCVPLAEYCRPIPPHLYHTRRSTCPLRFSTAERSHRAQETAGQVDMMLLSNGQPTIREGSFTSTNRDTTSDSVTRILHRAVLLPNPLPRHDSPSRCSTSRRLPQASAISTVS
jgi:hypothetical protein